MPELLANQLIVSLAAAGIVVASFGNVLFALGRQWQNRNDALHDLIKKEFEETKTEFLSYRAEIKVEMSRLRESEAKCQRALARMETALREHGIPPPSNSGWGNL